MRSVTASAFFLFAAIVATSAVATDLCANVATTGPNVVTWTGSCDDISNTDAKCWTPSVPTAQSTAVIPAGKTAQLAWVNNSLQTLQFTTFSVTNLVVAAGATLNVGGDAIQTTGCFLVQGTLVLNSGIPEYPWGINLISQSPIVNYLPDPAQPEGTDCATVNVGFTPRICGPGMLKVQGTLNVSGLYASVFQSGLIDTHAVLNLGVGGFIWGNITVKGDYVATSGYTYQHGYIYNYGTVNISTVAFDVWATNFTNRMPLLIENHGNLNIINAFVVPTNTWYPLAGNAEGTYRAVLVNFGQTAFYGYGGQSNWGFDVFNYGELMWSYTWMDNFFGGGTFVNKGTITVNTANVFLSTFHSIGGSIVLLNGGILNFGSSSSSASATMKLCQLTQGMPSDLQATFLRNARRRTLAARHTHSGRSELAVEQRGDCWWYGDFCYHSPYLWSPPVDANTVAMPKSVDASGLPIRRHGGTVRLRVHQLIAESELSVDTPCAVRYSVEDTSVSGDGSGSVVANLPVRVMGTLKLKAGAKWYVAAERKGAPFYGGGKVSVQRGATLFAGISAEFKHDGELEVARGGQFAVPRHASVLLSNHSFVLHPGSTLHVDGKLVLQEAKGAKMTVDHCGLLDGVGEVVMEKAGMLRCSRDGKHKNAKKDHQLPSRRH